MENINARIYFSLVDKNILVITQEIEKGIPTTKEQDIEKYKELQNFSINEIDFIELEYGTLADTFLKAKSYSINLETKSLDIVYFTQEELDSMQQQNQESQELNSRVTDITQYLSSSDEATIAEIENSILEIELNKTINGGM